MYQFGDEFLETVGLSSMPEAQRAGFLGYVRDQFETRIGEKMSEGLSEAQIAEFGKIVDNDEQTINDLLAKAGDYKNDPVYQALLENGGEDGSATTLNDYVTATWLNQNCPDYAKILEAAMNELKAEIKAQKEAILATL